MGTYRKKSMNQQLLFFFFCPNLLCRRAVLSRPELPVGRPANLVRSVHSAHRDHAGPGFPGRAPDNSHCLILKYSIQHLPSIQQQSKGAHIRQQQDTTLCKANYATLIIRLPYPCRSLVVGPVMPIPHIPFPKAHCLLSLIVSHSHIPSRKPCALGLVRPLTLLPRQEKQTRRRKKN